jgi:hypothetical protein
VAAQIKPGVALFHSSHTGRLQRRPSDEPFCGAHSLAAAGATDVLEASINYPGISVYPGIYRMTQNFTPMDIDVYGEIRTVSVLCLDLFWKPLQDVLRFVLVKDGDQRFILICSDLKIPLEEIISLYARRFKIEVTFKMFKHIVGGFCYHFWTKAWNTPKGKAFSIEKLEDMSAASKRRISKAANAIEAFVNLGMIAAGLLQLLAIEQAETIQRRYTWWMRTYSSIIPSEEMVRTVIQHELYHHFRRFKHTAIYRIIQSKRQPPGAERLKKAD